MPKLYKFHGTPPSRSVQVCAKALGLELEQHDVNVHKREQLKDEFLKLNPQHTVPTLVDDDGFVIWDSHAIMPYLVSKYGKTDSLYPNDLKKRAVIHQRLHFDSNVLFPRGVVIVRPIIYKGATDVDEEPKTQMHEAYDFVEKFLEGNDWIAGESFTIADICFLTSLSSWSTLVPLDEIKHSKIKSWLQRVEKHPCYEANVPGLKRFTELVSSKLRN